jgi:hypothetical protein
MESRWFPARPTRSHFRWSCYIPIVSVERSGTRRDGLGPNCWDRVGTRWPQAASNSALRAAPRPKVSGRSQQLPDSPNSAVSPHFLPGHFVQSHDRVVNGRPKAERETERSGVSQRTLDDPVSHRNHNGRGRPIQAGLIALRFLDYG